MRVNKNDLVCAGITAGQLRGFLREHCRSSFDVRYLQRFFGRKAAAALIADDWFESGTDETGRPALVETSKATSLRCANFLKAMTRAQADALVAGVLDRAAFINATPDFLHRIEWLAVFGSYLTDAAEFGDVDVLYSLADARPASLPIWGAAMDATYERACAAAGRRPTEAWNSLGAYGKLTTLTRQYLHGRHARLHLEPCPSPHSDFRPPFRTILGTPPAHLAPAR